MNAHLSAHGCDESLRVEPQAVLENDLDIFNVCDPRRRITVHEYEIGALALADGADLTLATEEPGAVAGPDPDGLQRREARFHQQLDLALIAEPRQHAPGAGRVRARQQQASGRSKRVLEVHFQAK